MLRNQKQIKNILDSTYTFFVQGILRARVRGLVPFSRVGPYRLQSFTMRDLRLLYSYGLGSNRPLVKLRETRVILPKPPARWYISHIHVKKLNINLIS